MNKLLKIKQKETCLLSVDMQNEYLDPKVGTSPLAKSDVDRILKNSNFLLNKLRKLSIPIVHCYVCLLYTSPSPRDVKRSRMPSSA